MEIKDLQPRMGKVDITIDVTDMGDIREFEKFGKQGKVCTATAKDATGEIKLSLWNEQVDQVNVGDKVKIENGYVNEYQGELQLTSGRFGKLEVLGKAEGGDQAPAAEPAPQPPAEDDLPPVKDEEQI